MDKIQFLTDDGNEMVEFFVLDQTRIGGRNYLLVAESTEDEAEALILKDMAPEDALESLYKIVDDDAELQAVAKVFEESIGDIEFEREV